MKEKTLTWVVFAVSLIARGADVAANELPALPRCQIVPLANHEVSLQIDGVERTRWHFGTQYSRPFFFPFNGPSGSSLTRIGHPGAAHHDHHRSVWFAHRKVNGKNFWSDQPRLRIQQKEWLAYDDGDNEARMAVRLLWLDESDQAHLDQQLVVAIVAGQNGEWSLEIQTTLRPHGEKPSVVLGKTNFGLLAVRVAKSISVHFGEGTLTNSNGAKDEAAIFGQPAAWVDYSGPVPDSTGPSRAAVVEGITYFDHPANPHFPAKWHVREDGWMGASLCFDQGIEIRREKPLTIRYLLSTHRGAVDAGRADKQAAAFASRPGLVVQKSTKKHKQAEVLRAKTS